LYKFVVVEPNGRPGCSSEGNIKMNLKEISYHSVDGTQVVRSNLVLRSCQHGN